jgi:hypothetical protein
MVNGNLNISDIHLLDYCMLSWVDFTVGSLIPPQRYSPQGEKSISIEVLGMNCECNLVSVSPIVQYSLLRNVFRTTH